MSKAKIVQTFHKVSLEVSKNSPAIFTVLGVVGLGATAVFSYKAAKKVEVIVEHIEEVNADEELELDKVEVGKDIIGALALPVATGAASIACIILSYNIQNNRIAGLAAALGTATAEHRYYKEKMKEELGEKKYNDIMKPTKVVERETEDKNGKVKKSKAEVRQNVPSLHGLWFDQSTEYASDDHDYNMAFINSVANELDVRMFRRGFLLLNEVYEGLGFERTRAGALIGWTTSGESRFDIETSVTQCEVEANGAKEPQIYVHWTEPEYIFDKVEYRP